MGIDLARREEMRKLGRVQVIKVDEWLHVICPYHEEFNAGAKRIKGKWRPAVKAWVFPLDKRESVMELVKRIYERRSACMSHRFVRVDKGIRCVLCNLFKERGT